MPAINANTANHSHLHHECQQIGATLYQPNMPLEHINNTRLVGCACTFEGLLAQTHKQEPTQGLPLSQARRSSSTPATARKRFHSSCGQKSGIFHLAWLALAH